MELVRHTGSIKEKKSPYKVLVKKSQEKGLPRRVQASLSQPHRQRQKRYASITD